MKRAWGATTLSKPSSQVFTTPSLCHPRLCLLPPRVSATNCSYYYNQRTFSTEEKEVKQGVSTRYLDQWTNAEVQAWFKRSKWAKLAKEFDEMEGEDLVRVTKQELTDEFGESKGTALYNAIQELKSPVKEGEGEIQ